MWFCIANGQWTLRGWAWHVRVNIACCADSTGLGMWGQYVLTGRCEVFKYHEDQNEL